MSYNDHLKDNGRTYNNRIRKLSHNYCCYYFPHKTAPGYVTKLTLFQNVNNREIQVSNSNRELKCVSFAVTDFRCAETWFFYQRQKKNVYGRANYTQVFNFRVVWSIAFSIEQIEFFSKTLKSIVLYFDILIVFISSIIMGRLEIFLSYSLIFFFNPIISNLIFWILKMRYFSHIRR